MTESKVYDEAPRFVWSEDDVEIVAANAEDDEPVGSVASD